MPYDVNKKCPSTKQMGGEVFPCDSYEGHPFAHYCGVLEADGSEWELQWRYAGEKVDSIGRGIK